MIKVLNPFKGYFYYLGVFLRYIGMQVFVIFILSFIIVAADSIGVMMLLPLLNVAEVLDGSHGETMAIFIGIFEVLGLPKTQIAILLFIVSIIFGKFLVNIGEAFYRNRMIILLKKNLQSKLLNHYTQMEYIYYASRSTGYFINVFNDQITNFVGAFQIFANFSTHVVTVSGYLFFSLFLNWRFTLLAVFGGMFVLILFYSLSEFSKRLSRKNAIEGSVFFKLLVQILQSLKYLSATSSLESLVYNAKKSISKLASNQFRMNMNRSFVSFVREPIIVIFLAFLLIFQILVVKQPISSIIISLILFYRTMGTLVKIQSTWLSFMETIGGFEMVRDEFKMVKANREIKGARPVGKLKQGIEFHDVSFAYQDEWVLNNINLTIPLNSTVAFVGESGAGKSTLVDLITLLLKPVSGQVRINGIPYKHLDFSDWRRNIGFVLQETVVFDDTIANNISLWTCDYQKDEMAKSRIEEAARQAFCHPFINQMPEGFETIVGDRGVKLSGGQRQRLFIARELFKRPKLLILDEATSSLDTESERYIQKSIDNLKGKMTVIIIAHRLSTIKNVDCIYVLDQGRIFEQGSFDELTSKNETKFSKMVAMQSL